jgi:hypothetical protein
MTFHVMLVLRWMHNFFRILKHFIEVFTTNVEHEGRDDVRESGMMGGIDVGTMLPKPGQAMRSAVMLLMALMATSSTSGLGWQCGGSMCEVLQSIIARAILKVYSRRPKSTRGTSS